MSIFLNIKNKLSDLYRKVVIRACDSFCPLKGELGESTAIHKKNFFDDITLEFMESLPKKDLLEFIKNHDYLKTVFKDYIGTYNVDYAKRWTTSGENNSSLWHHDSVGHRIKIFIGLSQVVADTGTCFIPNSHKNKYSSYLETRVDPDSDNQIVINLDRGDLMIFDTNSLHRGMYGANKRTAFTIEVSNPVKGYILPGDIGKRA
tara:strand:- start:10 stop:621 length:612 start_codon:yes stop_codon:yes gene_type:complete